MATKVNIQLSLSQTEALQKVLQAAPKQTKTTKRIVCRTVGGRKFSLRKIAIASPSGRAKRSAIKLLAAVPIRTGNTP